MNRTSVGKNAVILTGSKILVSMLGIITAMLLARFRTLEEYGTYSQIIMVADLVSSILLLGLPNSINYFLAKEDETEKRQKFLSVYYTLSTIMTIIIAICLLLSLPIIVRYFNNSLIKKFAYVFVIYPWASLMINSLSNSCIVYGKMRKLLYFNVAQSIATLFVLLMDAKILRTVISNLYVFLYGVLICICCCGNFMGKKFLRENRMQSRSGAYSEDFCFFDSNWISFCSWNDNYTT